MVGEAGVRWGSGGPSLSRAACLARLDFPAGALRFHFALGPSFQRRPSSGLGLCASCEGGEAGVC